MIVALCIASVLFAADETKEAISNTGRQYKALDRSAVERLGGRNPVTVIHDSAALTTGLNRMHADGWQLVGIESGYSRPIGGASNASASNSATYVFKRSQ